MNLGFLKLMTVLYVDDDVNILENIKILFAKVCKDIVVVADGIEALDVYKKSLEPNSDITIDIIVSDINMPNMDGLEFFDNIRKLNANIPFVITTGYANSDNLLRAIENDITYLYIKPVDIKKLIVKLDNISKLIYEQKFAMHNQKEAEEYLSIINKVAIVSKTNISGIITYVNDIFCEVSGYTRNELMGKSHNIVRHKDMPASAFKDLWQTIKNGQEWSGKVKNKAKDGETYHVNATIFPLFNDIDTTIKGYMGIRFLTTEEEEKKREFKSQVRSLVTKHKQEISDLREEKSNGDVQYRNDDFQMLSDKFALEKRRSTTLSKQVDYYEDKMQVDDKRNINNVNRANKKIEQYYNVAKQLIEKDKVKQDEHKVILSEQKELLEKLNIITQEYNKQNQVILELKDVIEHQDVMLSDSPHHKYSQ